MAAANAYLTDEDATALQDTLEQIARDFVVAFNKLDSRSGFIETEEREDLCHAFEVILDAVEDTDCLMNRDRIWAIMDEHRDW